MDQVNKKILIIEDDEDFLSILKIKFAGEGFSVFTASDGEEGVSMARKEKPDLILADILMPKMDGLEMAKKIKEFDKDALIIFLTNITGVDYINNIKKLGNSDYLIKAELRINDIVDKIKTKLGIK